MLDVMSDSIQRSRIENLQSREVDRQSPTGLIFLRINFCTNTRLLSSRYSVSLRAKHSVGPGVKPLVRGLVGDKVPLKLIMLMTFCNLIHKFV